VFSSSLQCNVGFFLAGETVLITEADLADVDRFLGETKVLAAPIPQWTPSTRPNELQAVWAIEDDIGIRRGELRFRVPTLRTDSPSVSVIFRGNSVARLDVVPLDECKMNPPWAHILGLPPEACGPHIHSWDDNREHVWRAQMWVLPARRPVEHGLRRVTQMLPWIADSVGISLTPQQRDFVAPGRTELFDR
jgi:hypothetical protein